MLPFWWDLHLLHTLPLPTTGLRVADLLWHLDLPVWSHAGAKCRLTPNEVAADPEAYPVHWMRAERSDLTTPLTVRGDTPQPVLIDGYHRLLKAVRLGVAELPGVVLPHALWPAIAHQEPEPAVLEDIAT